MKKNIIFFCFLFINFSVFSQNNENKLGAWYLYFYNAKFKDSQFGIQGDVQYRNFNIIGDLEQLLIRSGVTYKPINTDVTFTLGIANVTTGVIGDSNATTTETRIYQEVLLPQKIANRFYLTHRYRYEQRFVQNQDFRSRFRYNLFLNIPINKNTITKNTFYLALYNEIFINGEKYIGNNKQVPVFDRNRFYTGLGYAITDKIKIQLGFMNQSTENFGKNQLQFSLHQNF
jgi:hypothetical protein